MVEAGDARHVVDPPRVVTVTPVDLRALDGTSREQEALGLAQTEPLRPFNLRVGPMLRVQLRQLGETPHGGDGKRMKGFRHGHRWHLK